MTEKNWTTAGTDESNDWDEAKANRLHGLLVLVGITRLDPAGELVERENFFGHVVSTNSTEGIVLKLLGSRDGERYTLPPRLECFEPAEPGIYSLTSSDDVVTDPDFIATWTVRNAKNG
ncbi:MAG: hypothetical protein HY371_03365 [Devosia nanyangense]|nr:hypothetical protein [Devosia nanyangense]